VADALKSETFREGEMATPDGRTWLVRSNPVIEDGRVTGIVHVAINITMLKNAEDALQRANRQLNLLTAITRHDILNQIQVIMLLLSLIKDKTDISPVNREFTQLETVTGMIRSEIEFTRVYEVIGTQQPQWQDLKEILAELEVNEPVSLTFRVDDIEVYADALFRKVFANLLDNSLRHGENVTEISITTRIETDDLYLIYEDNGSGVLAEDKEKIFNRGFGKNTGFGLFLIREILSITTISIHETGTQGEGARFEMRIPPHTWRIKPPV
jgi:signal transduction histidine kinase